MKKGLFAALMLALTLNSYSKERTFDIGNYEIESSGKNTSADELPMSPYKDGSIAFFRNDTAYMFQPDSELEVGELTVCPELMGLGIEGTFAYDGSRNKLYFSKKSDKGNELHEATLSGEKWGNVRKLNIKGVMTTPRDAKGSTLPAARWIYTDAGVTGFYNPSLSKEGTRIYFSGDFKAGKGERDIWYIDQEEDNLWSFPENVDVVNTESREDYALVVGDTALFFASSRPDGKGDMDLYVSFKSPKEEQWGTIQNLGEKVNSDAADYNIVFNKAALYFISDRSGGAGGADIYRLVPLAPEREPELISEVTIEEPKEFHWVLFYFDFDKAILKPEYEVQLDEMAMAMKEFPRAKFEVIGHTDRRGSDEYNMILSERRAEYVKEMLVKRGIDPDKLITVPKGESELFITDPKNEADHEQNRRVEVKIIE